MRYNYAFVYPHQYYIRSQNLSNFSQKYPSVSSDDRDPDALEDGILRSLQVIHAQCGMIPKYVRINGLAKVRDSVRNPERSFWSLYFRGKVYPEREPFEIIPDPKYKKVADLYAGFYERAVEKEEAFYARLRDKRNGIRKSDPDNALVGLAGAAFISLFAIQIMKNNEECNEAPFTCW